VKPLLAGVLIIGSLYWDDEGGRDRWRCWRLDLAKKLHVHVPIRYGRRSASRGNTYTMVFARLDDSKFGQAIVLPCKHLISSVDDLVNEARWLWAAETKRVPESQDGELPKGLSDTWGSVAILPSLNTPEPILKGWREMFDAQDETLMVRTGGRLDIDWPTIAGDEPSVLFDLLLATTNRPTSVDSTPEQIAEAWNTFGFRNYFEENRKAGIITFQDSEIRPWLR
jgi:hypothetical protein